jgi:hypothetical protein
MTSNHTPEKQQCHLQDMEDTAIIINAMRSKENDTNTRCKNYHTDEVDGQCRKAMVEWCFTVVDAFDLSRETVAIAISILDRYLSSNNGISSKVLLNKQMYQLATITCFYTAVKIHEPVQLGISMLLKLCRGFYKDNDIVDMELDILRALDYRIYASTSPIEYVRLFLQLLPEWEDVSELIIENAMSHMDEATCDIYFSTCKVYEVAIACLAGALEDESCILSELEKEVLWAQLSRRLEFDIASNEIRKVERMLLAKSTVEPKRASQGCLPQSSGILHHVASRQSSSPVSVMNMTR